MVGTNSQTQIFLQARFGLLFDSSISTAAEPGLAQIQREASGKLLNGRAVHEIHDWGRLLQKRNVVETQVETLAVGKWLNSMLGK
jgi:hypothetical protein